MQRIGMNVLWKAKHAVLKIKIFLPLVHPSVVAIHYSETFYVLTLTFTFNQSKALYDS